MNALGHKGTTTEGQLVTVFAETLDKHNLAMVRFAYRWMPFGGDDGTVFAEFGVSVVEFYSRVLGAVCSHHPANPAHGDAEKLIAFCRRKLAIYGTVRVLGRQAATFAPRSSDAGRATGRACCATAGGRCRPSATPRRPTERRGT